MGYKGRRPERCNQCRNKILFRRLGKRIYCPWCKKVYHDKCHDPNLCIEEMKPHTWSKIEIGEP